MDALRKAAAPDASGKLISDLQKRVDALEKRLDQIDQTMLTKKDQKTMEEQEAANLAKAIAADKKQLEDADRLLRKQVAAIEKEMDALQVEQKFKVLETRVITKRSAMSRLPLLAAV